MFIMQRPVKLNEAQCVICFVILLRIITYYYFIITALLHHYYVIITWLLPGITEFLNFHDLSYNRGSMQDIMPFMLHLYTLDLSTNCFLPHARVAWFTSKML